jgi:hypothetical protein
MAGLARRGIETGVGAKTELKLFKFMGELLLVVAGALFIGAFAGWPLRHLFISGPSMGNKLRSAVKGVGCVPRTTITGAWDAPYDISIDLEME